MPESTEQPAPKLDSRGLPPGYDFDETMEVTPRDYAATRGGPDEPLLIDCRTVEERQERVIEPSTFIPLQELNTKYQEQLSGEDPDRPVVVYCRSGRRSLTAANFLRSRGHRFVHSMAGGILLWEADPEVE
jgi:rhodanese-related sulfurtransferase